VQGFEKTNSGGIFFNGLVPGNDKTIIRYV